MASGYSTGQCRFRKCPPHNLNSKASPHYQPNQQNQIYFLSEKVFISQAKIMLMCNVTVIKTLYKLYKLYNTF